MICSIAALFFVTRIGRADAGIGQPVTLGPPQVFTTGPGPYAVTAYSNDFGLPGLATINNTGDSVSVIQQTSSPGALEPAVNYSLPSGAHPQAVAVGLQFRQFSSPAKFLVVADTGINKVSVLLGANVSTFQQPVSYDVGSAPQDVATGSLTGDGNTDIVAANFGSNNVTVLTGNSDGTFGNAVSYNVSPKPRAVAVGQLDNGFGTDIATCGSDAGAGKVTVLLNNNGTTFQPGVTYDVGSDPYDIAVGDFNLDGKLDLVTANNLSNDVSILLNNGNGTFAAAKSYGAGPSPRSIAVGDLNLDGRPDLAVAGANGVNLLLNNGDGTFSAPVNFAMGQNPFGVTIGSLNTDVLPDIATANNGDGTINIRLNQSTPLVSFATPTPLSVTPKPHSIAAFNRFGKPALAVTDNDPANSRISVLYGIASAFTPTYDGRFGNPTHYPLLAGSQPEQVVVGNLGQISLPSLVVALPNANKVAILLGNSDDSFQSPVYKDTGTFPRSVTLADFNSDGNLDIAAANRASSTISIITGNADRTFQNAFTIANVLTSSPEFIVSGDFNNDGKADLATCNSGPPDQNKVNVLLGNGNGTFQPVSVYTVGMNPTFMTTGDFNQDGKLDLAVSNSSANQVSILFNTGNGLFQRPASIYTVGSNPNSISASDFNLDGKMDLIVTNGQSRTFSVLLNNGDGTFKPPLSFIVGQGPLGIAVGDFNLDNKPDVATANHDDGTISVVLNSTATPPLPAPPNDNFANAEILNGISGQTLGTNIGATNEINEPSHPSPGGNSSSVWYSWTAPADGGITIDTFGSTFDTTLDVYTGSTVSSLTKVIGNSDDFSPGGDVRVSSKVRFNAVSGTTYRIAVASQQGVTGNITLNWSLLPPPSNDNFASPEVISGAFGVITSTNAGATKEPGEPNHADDPGGASIWFRWTAPSSGNVTFNTSSSRICGDPHLPSCGYDTLLAVYTGSTLQDLSQHLIAKNDNETFDKLTSSLAFVATAGVTYQIAVDSKGTSKSDIVLSWFSGSNFNDSFASAVQISGITGAITSDVGPSNQAWFRWVAPVTGSATFSSGRFFSPTRSTFEYPSTLSIYSVSGQNALSQIGSNTGSCQDSFADRFCNDSTVNFSTVGQAVYAIQISKPSPAVGSATLRWSSTGGPPVGPANDNFAAAQVVTGFQGSVSFNNNNATKETGEPNHGGDPGGHSVWFNWTAPETVRITFSASLSGQAVFLGAYTGSSVSSPTVVGGGQSSVTFDATKDTTYHIAVDSQSQGSGSLSWRPPNAPLNDNFANAQTISGTGGEVGGTNINATSEAGEPQHAGSFSSASIWYSWTAPSNGWFTFNTDGSDVDTVLAVYSGTAVNNLSEVISNNDQDRQTFPATITSRVTFFALQDQVYKIAIAGPEGTLRLRWGAPRNISGRVTNIRGIGIANVILTLSEDGARTRRTDAQGFYNFPDVAAGGKYVVTPSKVSYGYDVSSLTYNPLTADVDNANFVANTPAYNIKGRITAGGIPIANIPVNVTGSAAKSDLTDSQGVFQFTNLPFDGHYTVTPTSPLYTFKVVGGVDETYFFPSLNQSQLNADFVAQAVPNVPELLLEQSDVPTTQAAALDALLLLRDPFPVVNAANLNWGQDQTTRVLLFVRNIDLQPGEPASAIVVHLKDAQGQPFDIQAENLWVPTDVEGKQLSFKQLTFRLPNTLAPGTCTIEVRVHGQFSNSATINIRN